MPSDRVDVVLTAPLIHVPPRGRTPRLSHVPVRATVPLPDLGADGHEAGPAIPVPGGKPLATRSVGGRLWRPIETMQRASRREPMRADEFRSWLAAGPGTQGHDEGEPGRCLAATPLVARMRNHLAQARAPLEWDAAQEGIVRLDGRARAADSGCRFIEGNVALLSGVPHVRMRGPLAFVDSQTGQRRILRHPGALSTYAGSLHALPFRVDLGAEQEALERRHPLAGTAAPSYPAEWPDNLFAGATVDGDDDIDLFVADALRTIVETFQRPQPAGGWPVGKETMDGVGSAWALASSGLVEPSERADLCLLVGRVVAQMREGGMAAHAWGERRLARYAAFAREVALPRLALSAPLPSDDADALGAFAP